MTSSNDNRTLHSNDTKIVFLQTNSINYHNVSYKSYIQQAVLQNEETKAAPSIPGHSCRKLDDQLYQSQYEQAAH